MRSIRKQLSLDEEKSGFILFNSLTIVHRCHNGGLTIVGYVEILSRVLKTPWLRDRGEDRLIEVVASKMRPAKLAPSAVDVTTAWLEAPPYRDEPIALYLHFPFCTAACHYCIFARTLDLSLVDRYIAALTRQLEGWARLSAIRGREVRSIYLGGGTPSVVPLPLLRRVMDTVKDAFTLSSHAQVTLETNPESLDPESLDLLKQAGINRISVGVQSLDDDILRAMGRTHRSADAMRVMGRLLDYGFDNINADLIFGWEGQRADLFIAQLKTLIELGVPHLSVFPLIKPHRDHREAAYRTLYSEITRYLEASGFTQYSIDQFSCSRSSENEYEKQAWMLPRLDIVGLGAGALGNVSRHYYTNPGSVLAYIEDIEAGHLGVGRASTVSREAEMRRSLLTGLKFLRIDRAAFRARFGEDVCESLAREIFILRLLGIVTLGQDALQVTPNGRFVVARLWSEIILENLSEAARFRS